MTNICTNIFVVYSSDALKLKRKRTVLYFFLPSVDDKTFDDANVVATMTIVTARTLHDGIVIFYSSRSQLRTCT